MLIKILNKEDISTYKQVRLLSLKESALFFSDSYEDELEKTITDYHNEIENDGIEKFILGAFSNSNHLIGFLKFQRDKRTKAKHRSMLHSLYVVPQYRKNGIATLLINKCLELATTSEKLEQVQLWVLISSNKSMVEFYKKFGFQMLGCLIDKDLIIDGQYVSAICMVKYL